MLSEGRNEAIPVMPFHELAEVVGDAVKSVKSDAIKNSFKRRIFENEGRKRLCSCKKFFKSSQISRRVQECNSL